MDSNPTQGSSLVVLGVVELAFSLFITSYVHIRRELGIFGD